MFGSLFAIVLLRADVFFVDYWDSYWIIQGSLTSQLYATVNGTLQNFMDEIEDFGFVPNGGRCCLSVYVFIVAQVCIGLHA